MTKCYDVFVISGLWVCRGTVILSPVLISVAKSDPRPVPASSQMQNLSRRNCTAQWFWPWYLWPPSLLYSYFWTSLLQFCLPVITSSLSILDLLRPLYRRPSAIIMPRRYHICCHAPLPPSQRSLTSICHRHLSLGPCTPCSVYPQLKWTCPLSWAITGIEFLVTELMLSHLCFYISSTSDSSDDTHTSYLVSSFDSIVTHS